MARGPSIAKSVGALTRERTKAGLEVARAEGRVGGRPKKLDAARRHEIVESVLSGRKTGAEMARLFGISPATVSRMVSHAKEELS